MFCLDSLSTLCQYETKIQGYSGLPIVKFEHPIANLNASEVVEQRVIGALVTGMIEALTLSREKAVERYIDRYTNE